MVLYRWELCGAFSTSIKNPFDEGKMHDRMYFSMSEMSSMSSVERYYLLAIMPVLCSSRRVDFLVMNKITKIIELWKDLDQIKQFYCHPEVEVDCVYLNDSKFKYFDRYRWLPVYDDANRIPRDTHYPGAINDEHRAQVAFKLFCL